MECGTMFREQEMLREYFEGLVVRTVHQVRSGPEYDKAGGKRAAHMFMFAARPWARFACIAENKIRQCGLATLVATGAVFLSARVIPGAVNCCPCNTKCGL